MSTALRAVRVAAFVLRRSKNVRTGKSTEILTREKSVSGGPVGAGRLELARRASLSLRCGNLEPSSSTLITQPSRSENTRPTRIAQNSNVTVTAADDGVTLYHVKYFMVFALGTRPLRERDAARGVVLRELATY